MSPLAQTGTGFSSFSRANKRGPGSYQSPDLKKRAKAKSHDSRVSVSAFGVLGLWNNGGRRLTASGVTGYQIWTSVTTKMMRNDGLEARCRCEVHALDLVMDVVLVVVGC